ncbi:MAG: RNA polymerase sigma factor [Crocinitomicaceae bacterium]|nr:RNA polymerase sigma factor [Crocinitomicaceae bacterium]
MRLFKKDYSTYTDEDLMRSFVGGDRMAFEQIYERYEQFMVNFFYRKLWNDRIKAEDFTHDLFTKIIDKPESFDLNRNFKTWLFSVANNMCKNEYKKQEVRKNTGYDVPEGVEAKDGAILPDKAVDKSNFAEQLKIELSKLNDKHREVFMLRHFEGLSLNEIAETLEINAGTVKSRLHHATKALAEKLAVFRKTMI